MFVKRQAFWEEAKGLLPTNVAMGGAMAQLIMGVMTRICLLLEAMPRKEVQREVLQGKENQVKTVYQRPKQSCKS